MTGKMTIRQKQNVISWLFIIPAVALIVTLSFYPMLSAFILSLMKGKGATLTWGGAYNYIRIFQDKIFIQSLINCIIYLVIEVPLMLIFALLLASLLNDRQLRFKRIFRTAIFLPCATSLVSYATIFRALFANDGLINSLLLNLGIIDKSFEFLANPISARIVIILALLWRWTGYNMVFYLAGLQNIEYSVYEAAKIDGASRWQAFWQITVPLLRPTILLTVIMSINGTLQMFDESVNLTGGGPANATITMSHYIYNMSFKFVPNFSYAAAMSYFILFLVVILTMIQLKVGDKRD
ncbi:carbohydrate ABC transporter permease [Amygdalobacter nucleatus]|uniref:ABC transporter, permease protein n=1 Tax=Amygdalobacter nucleatus TaxID=3029274 RepID=A0A133YHE4_9FIRM|nr:sugar ABC transporter permease [Amygdalobacter nucleatus]KXB42616.1 ABC transporter, permease protein [Amygdalobacter nucleatus]MDF0486185.1 sugar ABC transporter permease [Amygdalobacter nucleatus]WEG37257.1 sugar ABC transporter permease [Amygdalobacter nucleatus]